MRSYGQYCAVAKALDVVGDRWSLLIVRELMLRDAARYTDLRDGLPGVASNLLADRLRALEAAGVIEREEVPPPAPATLFRLTDRGRGLRDALHSLGQWGAPLLGDDFGDDAFRSHWLALPVELYLGDRLTDAPPISIGVHAGREDVLIDIADGGVRARPLSPDDTPDVTLTGPPKLVLGALVGKVSFEDARARGLTWLGDIRGLRRIVGGRSVRRAPA